MVIHSTDPPHTGSQKCAGCFGWIEGSSVYYVQKKGVSHGPLCPSCYSNEVKEKNRGTGK